MALLSSIIADIVLQDLKTRGLESFAAEISFYLDTLTILHWRFLAIKQKIF